MISKMGITFGMFIAYLIPGMIVLIAFVFGSNKFTDLHNWFIKNPGVSLSVVVLISFTIGLLLDAIRFLLSWLPRILSKTYKEWSKYDISSATFDDMKVYSCLIEYHFRFHQLYGNLSLALLVAVFLLLGLIPKGYIILLFVITFLCIVASCLTYYQTINNLRQRFPYSVKKGG